jgi:hypothetical protein
MHAASHVILTGLIGTAPSKELLDIWNSREGALVKDGPEGTTLGGVLHTRPLGRLSLATDMQSCLGEHNEVWLHLSLLTVLPSTVQLPLWVHVFRCSACMPAFGPGAIDAAHSFRTACDHVSTHVYLCYYGRHIMMMRVLSCIVPA